MKVKAEEFTKLALDQAALNLAQVEERRNRSLLARSAGSREDVDKAEASTKKSAAQVEAELAAPGDVVVSAEALPEPAIF